MDAHPFRLIRNLNRTREIVAVLLNHGFGDFVDRLGIRHFWFRWQRWVFRQPAVPMRQLTTVERIRLSLESLGPTFIKLGQVMSTRPDLVPLEMITELEKLQEQVPPFSSEEAVAQLERELRQPVSELFREFERVPLAAGSLGQVHRARHHDGTPLAVKIRRPGVLREIECDLSLMQELAVLAVRHIPESQIVDPEGLINHFARTIRREMNFAREGRSMDEFRRLFRNDPHLYVPRVYWELTTEAVLTMEFVDGLRVDEPASLVNLPVSAAEVATAGAKLYMKQAFEFGMFHGDPHPGNIRILHDGRICLLDYGMIGLLDAKTREQLVDLFCAISRQDVDEAVSTVLVLGEPYREIDLPLLQVDMRDFIGNYYGVPLERMNVGHLLADFVAILAHHGIRCPGSLMLLIRALVTLEGIGRKLDPEFNLASHLQPFVETVVRQRYHPQRLWHQAVHDSVRLIALAREAPGQLAKTLKKLSEDDLRIKLEHRNLDHFISEMERSSNRLVVAMVVAALIVASALVMRNSDTAWLSLTIYLLSSLLAGWLVYGVFRSGRL